MRGFELRGDVAVAQLEPEERMVMGRIVADVGLLLGGEQFGMDPPIDRDAGYQNSGHSGANTSEFDDIFRHLRGLEESLAEPDDPAVLRLLPSASRDDREVADEFRRLTEGDLRDLKVARLHHMWEALSEDGPEWEVPVDEALSTAAALTDVRLVLGNRLQLETDEDVERLHTEIELAAQVLGPEDEPVEHADQGEAAQADGETGDHESANRNDSAGHRDSARGSATAHAHALGVDPERIWLGMLFQALGWLQDTLVTSALGGDQDQEPMHE